MKFKRILAAVFVLALTLPLLTVAAHPGDTDSAGGHTDHDTGEYHYHHSYPAHEHYDADGNGAVDCPYDFDDKTSEDSGQSSNGSSGDNSYPGTSWSGTVSPDVAHETFSRLDWILGRDTSAPDTTTPATESIPVPSPSTPYNREVFLKNVLTIILLSIPILVVLFYNLSFRVEKIHPRLSSFLSYAASVFFLLTLPISGLPVILYFHLSGKRNKAKQSSKTQKKPLTAVRITASESQALPSQTFAKPDPDVDFRPVFLPESEVSVHARCRDTCRYLWYETLMIRSRVAPQPNSDACIYLWTALFYTAVKTLRSQSSVDRIYSYFAETTSEFVTEAEYTDLVVAKVRAVYRELREPLNRSKIDPRTANGRRDLWQFLREYSVEFDSRPDLEHEFLSASQRVWQTIADVFPQSHPYPKAGDIRYCIDDLPQP